MSGSRYCIGFAHQFQSGELRPGWSELLGWGLSWD